MLQWDSKNQRVNYVGTLNTQLAMIINSSNMQYLHRKLNLIQKIFQNNQTKLPKQETIQSRKQSE